MQIKITTQKRGEIERIQRDFKKHLSADVILRTTAGVLNQTVQRSIPILRKDIKTNYNIRKPNTSLKGLAKVAPRANTNHLAAGLELNHEPVPLRFFQHKQTDEGVEVSVRRGKSRLIRGAITQKVATFLQHEGVFMRGKYEGNEFVRGRFGGKKVTGKSGKSRNLGQVSQLKTASPFAMGLSKEVSQTVQDFQGRYVVDRMRGALQGQVDKITKQ